MSQDILYIFIVSLLCFEGRFIHALMWCFFMVFFYNVFRSHVFVMFFFSVILLRFSSTFSFTQTQRYSSGLEKLQRSVSTVLYKINKYIFIETTYTIQSFSNTEI